MPDEKPLRPASRQDVIQAIQHGMLFEGRKRSHHWDSINAQVAAEKLADYLARSNFVIMQGPGAPAHGGTSTVLATGTYRDRTD